ncbi:carboxypeptidase N subunit 2-like [Thrips palmi]|uniref:Carboxypeptidase N subunit 2-like n=1 Tax=Thrips palmi TaxID=161013 RepID=A0A6P8YZ79_THRPL|nr:carboxypeptidase N subunit 2-like [Thrips palmi]
MQWDIHDFPSRPRLGGVDGEDYHDAAAGEEDALPDVPDEPSLPDEPSGVCPAACKCRFGVRPLLVDCSNRKLSAFPDPTEIPEEVEVLDLSDNAIRVVPRDLPAWERLQELSLAGNQIAAFPPGALVGLSALEALDLSRNKIASLRHVKPDRFIVNNPVMQVLNLSGNGIQDLGHGSFQSLSSESLHVLDVSKCAVSSIDGEEALAALPALRVLRVADNPLQQLPVFATATELRELDASGCRLRSVPAGVLSALPQLQHLAVSRNPDLAHFLPPQPATPSPRDPDQLSHLLKMPAPWSATLQVLEAEECALHETSFLATLPNVTEVRLRGNRIAALQPGELMDNAVLQHLDLADNRLENLPADAFKGTEDMLKELDLSGNRLTALHPETFSLHLALRSLNVSRNPIASLQLSAPQLRHLDASHAELQVVAEAVLDGMPRLRHLNVSNNPLAALPERAASPGSDPVLHTLDVSFCRLTDLGADSLAALAVLQTLDLRGNRFTDPLKVEAFSENAILQTIRLGDNPWRCDCRTQDFRDMLDFLQAQPPKEDLHSLLCHSPESAQGQSWHAACLAPGAGSMASLGTWVFVAVMVIGVAAVAFGVGMARRVRRGKARRRRQHEQQQEEERRACEQEAERRRLHRRMQMQQQEQLRRQNMRAQQASSPDEPDPHPPSYEEAMFMDRMTKGDEGHSDSDSEEDEAFHEELQRKVARLDSAGRATDVIEEEEDEHTALSNGSGANNGSARGARSAPLNTRL